MRISLRSILLATTLISILFAFAFIKDDRDIELRMISSSRRLLRGTQAYEEKLGPIPEKGNLIEIEDHLREVYGIEEPELRQFASLAISLDESEYLFFWLSEFPSFLSTGVWSDSYGFVQASGLIQMATDSWS